MQVIEKQLGYRRKQGAGEFNGRFQEFEYLPGKPAENWDVDERHLSVLIPERQISTPVEVASRLADIIEKESAKII